MDNDSETGALAKLEILEQNRLTNIMSLMDVLQPIGPVFIFCLSIIRMAFPAVAHFTPFSARDFRRRYSS